MDDFIKWHEKNKEPQLYGRYITHEMIAPILKDLTRDFNVEQIGWSYNGIPINKVIAGKGRIKILIWSQMHGNEATGTKALFDVLRYLKNEADSLFGNQVLANCTLICLPIINPDGAAVYTRLNAQQIDLNRDAIDRKAPESQLLNEILTNEKPDYCFNLHDQRVIFSVGNHNLPATLSFLAPSEDEKRTLTKGRKRTMCVINAMYQILKDYLPGQIGRFSDEFYPTATGDTFQKRGFPTILIETGHFKGDYQREIVRRYNFLALLTGILYISNPKKSKSYVPYFQIPENKQYSLDIIFKNTYLVDKEKLTDIGVLYEEKLIDNEIHFIPKIAYEQDLSAYNADKIIDLEGQKVTEKDLLQRLIKK